MLEFGAGTGGLSVAMVLGGVKRVCAVEPIAINCEAGKWRTRAYGLEGAIKYHHLPDTRDSRSATANSTPSPAVRCCSTFPTLRSGRGW